MSDSYRNAVTKALAAFAAAWPNRWAQSSVTLAVWLDTLSDLEPTEVREAARRAVIEREWPPTVAEFRALVPRLCRCGKCYPCHARAVERAKRAVERGSLGADLDGPTHIGALTPRFVPRLVEGAKPAQIAPTEGGAA